MTSFNMTYSILFTFLTFYLELTSCRSQSPPGPDDGSCSINNISACTCVWPSDMSNCDLLQDSFNPFGYDVDCVNELPHCTLKCQSNSDCAILAAGGYDAECDGFSCVPRTDDKRRMMMTTSPPARFPVSPTATNASGEFYIASEYFNSGEYFRYGLITCADSYCHIVCDEAYGCEGLNVNVTSPSTVLVVQCLSYERSCFGAVINADAAHSLDLSCESNGWDSAPCREFDLYAGDVQNDLNILCNGRYACRDSKITASNVGNSFTMTCDGYEACSSTQLSAGIAGHASVSCIGSEACRVMRDFDLISNGPDVTVDFICVDGACPYTNFNIVGYINNGHKTNNISYVDSASSSGYGVVNISNFYSIDMVYSNDIGYSGSDLNYPLYAQTSQHLSVTCSGDKGCEYTQVFCPTEGTCDFDCIGMDSCGPMTIEIANDAYDGLNIDCSDPFYGCGYDGTIRINCTDSGPMYGKLLWSEYYQNMMCYGFCCPPNYGKTSTIVPTTTTVEDISTSDPTTTAAESISTTDPTITAGEGLSTSYATTTVVEDTSSSDLSSTSSDTASSFTTTKTKKENDDAFDNTARNDDYLLPTIISLAVFIAVAVVIVVYVIKKMDDKIKGLQALTENLQNNNVNIEMNGVTNATPQPTA